MERTRERKMNDLPRRKLKPVVASPLTDLINDLATKKEQEIAEAEAENARVEKLYHRPWPTD
jgi:hypothetical protein